VQEQYYHNRDVPEIVQNIDDADVIYGDQHAAPSKRNIRGWDDEECNSELSSVQPHAQRQQQVAVRSVKALSVQTGSATRWVLHVLNS
jgi:hypothetical protein